MSSGQSYVIRPAASDDVAAATSLVRRSIAELCQSDHHNMAAIVEGLLINKTPENMQAWIETPGSYVFVAEAGPIMAGVGGLTGDGGEGFGADARSAPVFGVDAQVVVGYVASARFAVMVVVACT
jgi:hypothetical protein